MRHLGFDTVVSAARLLWALLHSSRERLTLDRLRSDLSHETAAKIARLSGLVEEWRHGRFQFADVGTAQGILLDLQRVYLRHPRPACARFGTFARLVRLLGILRMAQRRLAVFRPQQAPSPEVVARFGLWVAILASESRALVEAVSRRHGIRFTQLVEGAAAEIRRELGQGKPEPAVSVEMADNGAGFWVARGEVAAWSDVLRNFIRNGVQASADRQPPSSKPVTVRVRPLPARPGTSVEILDEGVGMSPDEAEQMWREGISRHGAQRGRGLTEAKRAFVEKRAALEVRSARGVGTCVRIDLPHRDVAIRTEPLWTSPPLVVPGLLALGILLFASPPFLQPSIEAVRVDDQRVVRAFGADGSLLWQRDLGAAVIPNGGTDCSPRGRVPTPILPHIVLKRSWPHASGVVLATVPLTGPGSVWRLGARGRTEWVHALRWPSVGGGDPVALVCVSEFLVPWGGMGRQAIALNVRDRNFSSTAIQFITLAGDSLGTYYHPGHLQFHSVGDLDGDGKPELLLNGMNNDVRSDTTYIPRDPGAGFYADCLILLEPPVADGQAYPCTRWPAMRRASEDAYLIFPPLKEGERPFISFVTVGRPNPQGATHIEVVIRDGRIYSLDGSLRPLDCIAGDNTGIDRGRPPSAMVPFVYFHGGIRESIDVPIRR